MTDHQPRRALIVEDELLVAMLIEDMLAELGFEIVGPAARVPQALKFAAEKSFDLAILDINLGSENSFPVARALQEKGTPFIFATGYGPREMGEQFGQVITLQKPFELRELERAIANALASGPKSTQ